MTARDRQINGLIAVDATMLADAMDLYRPSLSLAASARRSDLQLTRLLNDRTVSENFTLASDQSGVTRFFNLMAEGIKRSSPSKHQRSIVQDVIDELASEVARTMKRILSAASVSRSVHAAPGLPLLHVEQSPRPNPSSVFKFGPQARAPPTTVRQSETIKLILWRPPILGLTAPPPQEPQLVNPRTNPM